MGVDEGSLQVIDVEVIFTCIAHEGYHMTTVSLSLGEKALRRRLGFLTRSKRGLR